jgi:hypothetical protein
MGVSRSRAPPGEQLRVARQVALQKQQGYPESVVNLDALELKRLKLSKAIRLHSGFALIDIPLVDYSYFCQ